MASTANVEVAQVKSFVSLNCVGGCTLTFDAVARALQPRRHGAIIERL
jgi:hypothetical protein